MVNGLDCFVERILNGLQVYSDIDTSANTDTIFYKFVISFLVALYDFLFLLYKI